jgi:hypothetical protein
VDDCPGVVVLDNANMRKTTVPVLHVFETTLYIVGADAPCFEALVRHPILVFGNPAGSVTNAAPEDELGGVVVKANNDIRVVADRPEFVPPVVIL